MFSIYDDDFDGNLDDTLEANINYGGLQVRNPTFGTGVQWENITNPVDNSAWLPYEVVWTSNGTVTNISRYQYVINKAGYPLEIKNAETGEVLKSYTYDCFSK